MSSPFTSPSSYNYTICRQSVNCTNGYSKTGAKLKVLWQMINVDMWVKEVRSDQHYWHQALKIHLEKLPFLALQATFI